MNHIISQESMHQHIPHLSWQLSSDVFTSRYVRITDEISIDALTITTVYNTYSRTYAIIRYTFRLSISDDRHYANIYIYRYGVRLGNKPMPYEIGLTISCYEARLGLCYALTVVICSLRQPRLVHYKWHWDGRLGEVRVNDETVSHHNMCSNQCFANTPDNISKFSNYIQLWRQFKTIQSYINTK